MTRKKELSRQARWQREQLKKGRCRLCGRKRSKKSKLFCPTHYRLHNEQNRAYRERIKARK